MFFGKMGELVRRADIGARDSFISGIKGGKMRPSMYVLILLFFFQSPVFAAWEARVVDAYDGDTLILSDDGRAIIIRLFGVDCPEKGQPFGLKAKDYSSRMVVGKEISIVTVEKKRYPRCMVYVEGECLNEELLSAGYAWYDQPGSSDEHLEKIEQIAAEKKKGLWALEDPVPPWKFRSKENVDEDKSVRRCYTINLGSRHKGKTASIYRPQRRRGFIRK
jgi:micrococcal nuclease